jgi:hypothetical protein
MSGFGDGLGTILVPTIDGFTSSPWIKSLASQINKIGDGPSF